MRTTSITIHPDALMHNLKVIKKQLSPNTKILAMVKADAYGHGIEATVPALIHADGFGVACLSEAMAVKKALDGMNVKKPIVLIEGAFSLDEWKVAVEHDFSCLIHHQNQLAWALAHQPKQDQCCHTIWLKYNTGMSRLGFNDDQIILAAKSLTDAGYRLILTSHFACADDKSHPLNALQISKFDQALARIQAFAPDTLGSLCNSAGIFNFKDHHHDWVRAGIALYGSKPVADQSAKALNLMPAMTLSAQVMAIHTLAAGDSIGYSALWAAQKPHKIAVVSIGYGDGYPRVVMGAKVSVTDTLGNWHLCNIIGRVAMDMFMIDIDGLDIAIDAPVVLWGDSPTIDEVALCAGTIGYELMCRLTTRPKRCIMDAYSPNKES
ncbi:alanine racemase [Moraxella canis]|uniref:Alanine racemase n=1 Tax=Moraxella canis TaxID=90239 RepID=A0A1S9ZJ26_9GAMM|nr:alanine racemase [Moraxella canis]OOR83390.1 alanine racemase [Moraxella canis]